MILAVFRRAFSKNFEGLAGVIGDASYLVMPCLACAKKPLSVGAAADTLFLKSGRSNPLVSSS